MVIYMPEQENIDNSNKALMGCIISLILPGIGLLLSKNYKTMGIVIFIIAIVADIIIFFLGSIGALCIVGMLIWVLIPIVHLLAAIHSYDSIVKEEGGKPIMFN